ncbi:GntR family transcriptional regulator, transcriptional repressor for pyruvate dehydrogenase complex [Monaibacterium marinum]|uniref:Pyruvate dehydrogenase complex repressor n=1 Tax=Pontivivens marinum TaxID=1690039 RepID=A0A2C9CVY7_9RHOB|nr:FCD domain-containing protein [Monaibacterium marinum]SOH94569.1 GntR family transcriptional regulator, transcriptional repressor for pyruvate dehydrogenase complex [Monaibacterium marinum]
MPFKKIEQERVSDAITRQIEALILRGVLRPGERLPAERDLAAKLGASRPSLRESLSDLENRELIVTRPGAGAYVAEVLGNAFAPSLIALFSTHEEAFFDYLSFRRDLEGMAAERAARFATPTDLEVIDAVFKKMEAAHTLRNPESEAELDVEFHMSIVEAAHNVVMMHMMRSMFEMLKKGVFYNRRLLFGVRDTRTALLEHHRAVHSAIMARDPARARAELENHLTYIEDSMRAHLRRAAQEETAQLRHSQITGIPRDS